MYVTPIQVPPGSLHNFSFVSVARDFCVCLSKVWGGLGTSQWHGDCMACMYGWFKLAGLFASSLKMNCQYYRQ